jgi:hypothetical protein
MTGWNALHERPLEAPAAKAARCQRGKPRELRLALASLALLSASRLGVA